MIALESVGFTGTRKGMNDRQQYQLTAILNWLLLDADLLVGELHHGAGPGVNGQPSADQQAAQIAIKVGWVAVAHPPAEKTAAAMLARNVEVVDAVKLLIAAPETDVEVRRSGTWATIRYARERGIPVLILWRGTGVVPARRPW